MSAVIDLSNNRENMAYKGETPWHGLGIEMPAGADLDQWRIEAGLEWEARKAKVMFKGEDDKLFEGNSEIIYRSDTHKQLGVATSRYKPVQPEQVVEFFRDLCEKQDFSMETLGSLDGGKRIWALASTGEDFRLAGQDKVDSFVLLATSFDGTMATRAQFTSVRVVCQNTLSLAVTATGGNFVSIKHSADFEADSVKTDLGIYKDAFKEFEEKSQLLASKGVSDKKAMQFIKDVLAGEDVELEDLSTRSANQIKNVYDLFKGDGKGSDLKSSKGTLWGAVNSITEYVDHHKGYKQDSRLKNAWFGQGDQMKTLAFGKALEMAS